MRGKECQREGVWERESVIGREGVEIYREREREREAGSVCACERERDGERE